jgi:hypothetical protein
MDTALDHDGVCWTYGQRTDVALGAGGAVLLLLVGGIGGTFALGWLAGAGIAAVALVPALIALQALRRTTVRLTTRALSIEGRAPLPLGWGSERREIRIDDIRDARCAQSDRGDWALVVRTRDETVVVGSGHDEDWLRWLCSAVEHARARNAQREAVDGREWGFLRTAPEAIERLRE